MRHAKAYRHLSRTAAHRRALFRNMATSLIAYERFETTLPKAKELRRVVEPLIALAAKDTLPARRQAYSYLLNKGVVHKLFAEIGPRYSARPGGYTRIVRTRIRHGDAADMAVIELVKQEQAAVSSAKKKKSAAPKKADKKSKAKAA